MPSERAFETGDVFWFDSKGDVALQMFVTVALPIGAERPTGPEYDAAPWQSRLGLNRVLPDDEVAALRRP